MNRTYVGKCHRSPQLETQTIEENKASEMIISGFRL